MALTEKLDTLSAPLGGRTLLQPMKPKSVGKGLLRQVVFVCLGAGHVLFYNFMVTTSKTTEDDIFPGQNWLKQFPRVKSASLLAGFLFSLKFSHRLPFFWSIFVGYGAMGVSTLVYFLSLLFAANTAVGFYTCLAACAVNSIAAAVTRSRSLGVAFTSGRPFPWCEAQGLGLSGLIGLSLSSAVNFLAPSTGVIIWGCFGFATIFQTMLAFSYPMLQNMADEVDPNRGADDAADGAEPLKDAAAVRDPAYQAIESQDVDPPCRPLPQLIWLHLPQLLTCFCAFYFTFAVWPTVVMKWEPPHDSAWTTTSYGLLLFTPYQLGDSAGRLFAKWPIPPTAQKIAVLSRFGFVFLFLCIKWAWFPFLASTAFRIVALTLFAASSGYLFTVTNSTAAQQVPLHLEKIRLAPVIGLSFLLGILGGSWTGPVVDDAFCFIFGK